MTSLYPALIAVQETFMVNGETFSAQLPIFSFRYMGFMQYPITFCALMVLVLAGRAAWRMRSEEAGTQGLIRSTIDGSLFWGGYALVLGVLGTVMGITLAAHAVEAVGEVHTSLVWGGIKVALSTTIYGLLVFLASGLVWYALRHVHRRTVLRGA